MGRVITYANRPTKASNPNMLRKGRGKQQLKVSCSGWTCADIRKSGVVSTHLQCPQSSRSRIQASTSESASSEARHQTKISSRRRQALLLHIRWRYVRRSRLAHSPGKVPRIISVVPLIPSVSCERFLRQLLPSIGLSEEEISALRKDGPSSFVIPAQRFKTALHFNVLPPYQLYPTLDAALVSDMVIVLLSSVDEVQLEGETILRCLQGQAGGVNVVPVVQVSQIGSLC